MLCLSVISSTKIADVNGVRVTPVKNPTMPDNINRFVLTSDKCIHPEKNAPIVAPALRAGANTPPAAPVVKDKTGPAILSKGTYQGRYLSAENNDVVITSFPEPNIRASTKKARVTTMSAQHTTYNAC